MRPNPTDRVILPRPANLEQSNDVDKLVINQLSASEILEPQRKKRGLPSKDFQERRAAAAARGEPYLSLKPSTARNPKKNSISTTSSGNLGILKPVHMPTASPDPLETPQPPPTAKSSYSSDEKKRTRGTKSDTPSSPISPSKKRDPRRSVDQSPATSAPKPFPSIQLVGSEIQYLGSIEQLPTRHTDQPTFQKAEDAQVFRTGPAESIASRKRALPPGERQNPTSIQPSADNFSGQEPMPNRDAVGQSERAQWSNTVTCSWEIRDVIRDKPDVGSFLKKRAYSYSEAGIYRSGAMQKSFA